RPDGLLKPEQIAGRELSRHELRFAERPWAVGIDHDPRRWACRLARAGHRRYIDLVQLHVLIAALHGLGGNLGRHRWIAMAQQARIGTNMVSRGTAEQTVERHACAFTGEVP